MSDISMWSLLLSISAACRFYAPFSPRFQDLKRPTSENGPIRLVPFPLLVHGIKEVLEFLRAFNKNVGRTTRHITAGARNLDMDFRGGLSNLRIVPVLAISLKNRRILRNIYNHTFHLYHRKKTIITRWPSSILDFLEQRAWRATLEYRIWIQNNAIPTDEFLSKQELWCCDIVEERLFLYLSSLRSRHEFLIYSAASKSTPWRSDAFRSH